MNRLRGKKLIPAVLLALGLFALAACGANNRETTPTGTETSSPSASQTSGVVFEPISTEEASASPSDAPSPETEKPSPSPANSPVPSSSPSKSPEPAKSTASPSPSPSGSHGHESPKPSGGDDDPKPEPSPSQSPSPSPPEETVSPSPSAEEEKTVRVEIKDFAFSPAEITVAPGTIVEFVNRDKVKHTATADGGSFDTGLLGKNESKTFVFSKVGTFSYFCSPHPDMKGTIIVKAK